MPSPWRNQIKQDIKKQIFEKEQKALSSTDVVVNRHMARFLTDMKEAGCPKIWIDSMKSEFVLIRHELNKLTEPKDAENVVNSSIITYMDEMTEAHCPKVFVEAMLSELVYLRSDLNDPDRESFGNK